MIATLIAALALLGVAASPALAASYPDKAIKIVVPYTPGGSVDLVGREIGRNLHARLGQTVIIENRSGASANIGADYVAKSDADGYTLLMSAATTLAAAPSLFKDLPYDPRKDLMPVALVAAQPNVLVVRPTLDVTSLSAFTALARQRPGGLNYAIASVGGPQHMSGELYMTMTQTKLTQVPYRGGANAITDLLGGQVDAMFAAIPEALPFIEAGRLRPLAVTSRERSALLPDVVSLHEAGLSDYELIGWIGLAAPSGTPPAVVAALNDAVNQTLADPAFKTWLHKLGLEPLGGTQEAFAAFVDQEVTKYRQLIDLAGIQPL